MGTNFYINERGREGAHIGKRSAAGLYCWNCRVTLCKGGEKDIHHDRSGWHDACPKCGKKPEDESISVSSAGRELGFNTLDPAPKTGVASCSSFSWACNPIVFNAKAPHYHGNEKWIIDEYGHKFTKAQFQDVLSECPVQFHDSIGLDFC